MTTTTREQELKDKAMKVAHYVMDQSKEIGRDYHTGDIALATLMATALTKMTTAYNAKEVNRQVDALIESHGNHAPSIEVWTFMCLFTNWLSWGWHANGEDEISKAWSEAWYKIDEYSRDTLKGDDLNYYVKTTD